MTELRIDPSGPGAGTDHVEVRTGRYYDSVTLMQASQAVAATPGLLAAQLAMATDLNLDVVRGMGFAVPEPVSPNDLLVALRSRDGAALAAGLAAVDAVLARRQGPADGGGSGGGAVDGPALTVGSAVARAAASRPAAAALALISVPGQHAFTEAMDALDHGAHVMVFSDNVPVAQEVRLKQAGAERGLLVMGPDCGTAVVSGVGLGFANVVLPGPVGVVAASGTGAQQVLALLDGAGVGVSHCLGVGGRDLSAPVGGLSTRQALAMLDADPATELILVVSKPPDPQIEASLVELAATLATPVRFATLGPGRPDLTAAARGTVEALGLPWLSPQVWTAPQGSPPAPQGVLSEPVAEQRFGVLRGAFCGGTLCDEAMLIAAAVVGPVPSNIPLVGAPRLASTLEAGPDQHAFVDFGDDELTRGRPHPMIDATLRTQWISRIAAQDGAPGNGLVLLLDVVLGHGAQLDPAADLAPALRDARAACVERGVDLAVIVSLCGTAGDPQGLARQAELLQAAGATVFRSNADAARAAVGLVATGGAR